MASTRREIEQIIREAEAQGWTRRETKNGVRVYSPDGVTTVGIHWTPSDHRWKKNLLRDLRKGGFIERKG